MTPAVTYRAPRFASEREERYAHRLEAFSDIVIGFSLAQMSMNFLIPKRAIDVYTHPVALSAFVWTFAWIVLLWWSRHRLFEDFFVPRASTVVLNFVTLALVIWLICQLQLYVRFVGTPSRVDAAVSYVVTYALIYALNAVTMLLCVRIRWPDLDAETRRQGVNVIGRLVGLVSGTLVGLAVSWPLGFLEWSLLGIFLGTTRWRLVRPNVYAHYGVS
jgi:uncharacterized membrane protein